MNKITKSARSQNAKKSFKCKKQTITKITRKRKSLESNKNLMEAINLLVNDLVKEEFSKMNKEAH